MDAMEAREEILPCPWCDEKASVRRTIGVIHGDRWVECLTVGCATGGPARETDAEAISAWNRVAALPALLDEAEAALEMIWHGGVRWGEGNDSNAPDIIGPLVARLRESRRKQ